MFIATYSKDRMVEARDSACGYDFSDGGTRVLILLGGYRREAFQ